MTSRTTSATVRFGSPFRLAAAEGMLPAGDYTVETDEEQVDGLSFAVWHRTVTFIHLPAIGTAAGTKQLLQIDPAELDRAIKKDTEIQ